MTPAQRAIAVTIVVAFLAGLAGMGLGRIVFAPERTPSLHEVLHNELDLTPAQEQEIEALERDFATRRRALEVEMRAANAELAAAMREEHEYGPASPLPLNASTTRWASFRAKRWGTSSPCARC